MLVSIEIRKVDGGYIALLLDAETGEYRLVGSKSRSRESLSKLLHEQGYDQRDFHTAMLEADPEYMTVGRW